MRGLVGIHSRTLRDRHWPATMCRPCRTQGGRRGTQQEREKRKFKKAKKQKAQHQPVSFHKNLQCWIVIISGWLERVTLCTSQPPPSHRKVGIVPIFVSQQQTKSRKAMLDMATFNWESEFSDLTWIASTTGGRKTGLGKWSVTAWKGMAP